jgi:hypothetical protein
MTEVHIKDEHKDDIDFFVKAIEKYTDSITGTQNYYEEAVEMSTHLYAAQRTMIKLNLGTSDASSMRNAEILSHFINEARHSDEKLAFYRDTITALREALSLFVADNYKIDITKEWQINVDQGMLIYDEQSSIPQ